MVNLYGQLVDHEKQAEEIIKNVQKEILRDEDKGEEWETYEKALYQQYKEANEGKQFIDIDHIENIKVKNKKGKLEKIEYDILIVMAKKNIGKTTGILYKLFDRHTKKGQKVIFMRTSKVELEDAMNLIVESDKCPFKIETIKKQEHLIHKETNEDCGLLKDFKTANRGSGGEYKDYGAIMYDECCPWENDNRITEFHYYSWSAMASSITRNKKKGVKIYAVGNITQQLGFLKHYGINPEDKLRYIWRSDINNPENICKILYINAENIYSGGIENQVGAVQGMAAHHRHQLYNNTACLNGKLIINNSKIWRGLEYASNIILCNAKGEPYIFQLKKTPFDRSNPERSAIYVIKVQKYVPHLITEGKTFTNCPIIGNMSNNITYLENIEAKKFIIYDKARAKKLKFYDNESQLNTQSLIKNITPEERAKHGF